MKNKKKYELIDYFLFDERLSPAALKIHEAWCRDNGYKPQATSNKRQATSGKLQATSGKLAPRYNSSDFEPRRGEKKTAANCRRTI
jgi:hypothetical protein